MKFLLKSLLLYCLMSICLYSAAFHRCFGSRAILRKASSISFSPTASYPYSSIFGPPSLEHTFASTARLPTSFASAPLTRFPFAHPLDHPFPSLYFARAGLSTAQTLYPNIIPKPKPSRDYGGIIAATGIIASIFGGMFYHLTTTEVETKRLDFEIRKFEATLPTAMKNLDAKRSVHIFRLIDGIQPYKLIKNKLFNEDASCGVLIITGIDGSGKSHLANHYAKRLKAKHYEGESIFTFIIGSENLKEELITVGRQLAISEIILKRLKKEGLISFLRYIESKTKDRNRYLFIFDDLHKIAYESDEYRAIADFIKRDRIQKNLQIIVTTRRQDHGFKVPQIHMPDEMSVYEATNLYLSINPNEDNAILKIKDTLLAPLDIILKASLDSGQSVTKPTSIIEKEEIHGVLSKMKRKIFTCRIALILEAINKSFITEKESDWQSMVMFLSFLGHPAIDRRFLMHYLENGVKIKGSIDKLINNLGAFSLFKVSDKIVSCPDIVLDTLYGWMLYNLDKKAREYALKSWQDSIFVIQRQEDFIKMKIREFKAKELGNILKFFNEYTKRFLDDPNLVRLKPLVENGQFLLDIFDGQSMAYRADLAFLMSTLGNVQYYFGKYDEAKRLHEKSLKLMTRVYGTSHVEVAKIQGNLVTVLQGQCEYKQALVLARKSYITMNRIYGEDSPEVVMMQHNIGCILAKTHDFEEALSIQKQV